MGGIPVSHAAILAAVTVTPAKEVLQWMGTALTLLVSLSVTYK